MVEFASKIYYQNAPGLRTKSQFSVKFFSGLSKFPIVCLTETWFNLSCFNDDYFPPNYRVLRKDRTCESGIDVRGGEIVVGIPDVCSVTRRIDLDFDAASSL